MLVYHHTTNICSALSPGLVKIYPATASLLFPQTKNTPQFTSQTTHTSAMNTIRKYPIFAPSCTRYNLCQNWNVKSQGEHSWVKLTPVWKFRKLYLDASNDKSLMSRASYGSPFQPLNKKLIKNEIVISLTFLTYFSSEFWDINSQLCYKVRIARYKLVILRNKVRIVWYKLATLRT